MTTRTRSFESAAYWDRRYMEGGDSGAGSQGAAAKRKARVVNTIMVDYHVGSVVDWGVGDGVVLAQLDLVGVDYTGVDVSRVVLERVARRFPDHWFVHTDDADGVQADMAMSLDVIFHQITNRDYKQHLRQLFGSARRLVVVHATDHDGGQTATHVQWRRWTSDIPAGWRLVERPADPTVPGFYLCERRP